METDTRAQVWAKTHGHCWYCGKLMNPWSDFTVDHMDPRKQGGGDELPNLVPCCKTCNSQKHAKTVKEFRQYLHSKAEHRFWFEHANILLPVPAESTDDHDEALEGFWPSYEDFDMILAACLYIGAKNRSGLGLTLLAFINMAVEWGKEEEVYISCNGWFDLEEIAHKTGFAIERILSQTLSLIYAGALTVLWHGGPHGSHGFDLNISSLLAVHSKLREQERTALSQG